MRKTIPAQDQIICDGCGKECGFGPGQEWRKAGTLLMLKRSGLDYLGDPCCDASLNMDLCDKCGFKLDKALQTIFKEEV